MKSKGMLLTALGCLGAMAVLGQAPAQQPAAPAAPQTGPGVQAPADAKYAEFVASKCKTPPPARGGGAARGPAGPAAPGGAAAGPGGAAGGANAAAAAGPPAHREYMVTEIPGVIAAGQKWKSIWTGTGNNADGILATPDGGILAAQNTNSAVMKIDKDNKVSTPYNDTKTGGALAMSKNGALFVVSRGLPTSILQLEPRRGTLADTYNGEPLDCIGGTINDLTADSKGGVYFTMGGVYYANSRGVVTKFGTLTGVNGIILSADEKTLYVTGRVPAAAAAPAPAQGGQGAAAPGGGAPGARGGGAGGGVVAFDVQADGSLTNERQFATSASGLDGSTVDSQGRVYSTGGLGVQVFAADGKFLGEIPAPLNLITAAFSGPDKKTLYGVANNQRFDEIFTIQMISQGYKDRAK
jgi:sugar lactone lactonase YvrE